MSHYGAALVAAMWLLASGACAHRPAAADSRGPAAQEAGVPLDTAEAALARAVMQAARAPVGQLSATARTTRFSSDGRVRANLQLLLARPDRLRVTVLSPHGPPLWAMACDGAQITALDVPTQAYSQQPATPLGLAHYLGGIDLDLDAAAWVSLLVGEMDVPLDATASRCADGNRTTWVWRWTAGQRRAEAVCDANTGQLLRASVVLGDGREGTVKVQGRSGATHLPQALLVHVGPGAQRRGREPAIDVEIVLTDVQLLAAPFADEAFIIAAPAVPVL